MSVAHYTWQYADPENPFRLRTGWPTQTDLGRYLKKNQMPFNPYPAELKYLTIIKPDFS